MKIAAFLIYSENVKSGKRDVVFNVSGSLKKICEYWNTCEKNYKIISVAPVFKNKIDRFLYLTKQNGKRVFVFKDNKKNREIISELNLRFYSLQKR